MLSKTLQLDSSMMKLVTDLGMQYATPKSKRKQHYGIFLCHCGKTTRAVISNIVRGSTKSCGCTRTPGTHNLSNHVKYSVWKDIKKRCFNTKCKTYKNYGGRGITLQASWIDTPTDFLAYIETLDNYGKEGYSIDRVDNNGNYEKGNLKWSTQYEQCINMQKTISKRSGEKYIKWHKPSSKWNVIVAGVYVGTFVDLEDAVKAKQKHLKEIT